MRRNKQRLKALVLVSIAAVLGSMTFSASGAQATGLPGLSTPGSYSINLGSALLAEMTMQQVGMATLSIPGRLIEFKCQTSSTLKGKISTSSDAEIEIEYSECLPTFFGVKHACPLENNSFVLKALVLPILHSGETFLLFEPLEGTNVLIVLPWKPALQCPPPGTITGSVTASVSALESVQPLIALNSGVQLLTGDLLRFGSFTTYMQSHGELELLGAHQGLKLGIH